MQAHLRSDFQLCRSLPSASNFNNINFFPSFPQPSGWCCSLKLLLHSNSVLFWPSAYLVNNFYIQLTIVCIKLFLLELLAWFLSPDQILTDTLKYGEDNLCSCTIQNRTNVIETIFKEEIEENIPKVKCLQLKKSYKG